MFFRIGDRDDRVDQRQPTPERTDTDLPTQRGSTVAIGRPLNQTRTDAPLRIRSPSNP